uniref:NADH dehydrogenase subunit 2 n=1 Tax=Cosmolaelaps hrdyi TaxID=3126097 RepID=UPI0030E5B3BC
MMMTWMKYFSFSVMIFSVLVGLMISNWFIFWMSFEMNILTFLFVLFEKNNLAVNSMMKYFFIQSFTSVFFLLLLMMMNFFVYSFFFFYMILLLMMMKLGLPPFYFWLMEVCESMSWNNLIIFSTVQKILPLYVISKNELKINLINLVIFFSLLVGIFMILNQISLRKFLVYSSMMHLGWMLFALKMQSFLWMVYFYIYMVSILMMVFFNKFYIFSISQIMLMSTLIKMMFLVSFLNFSGIPPFLMFFPKIFVILLGMKMELMMILFLVSFSLMSSMVYLFLSSKIFLVKSFFLNQKKMNFIMLLLILLMLMNLIFFF